VVEAPALYVAGEESAALEVIEGRPARPRRKPPYPTEAGLWGRPTVVNNVETLAVVAAILRDGPAAYRSLGTAESPGTLLVTLSGWVERPGVYEVAFGTTVRTIIQTSGGGVRGGKGLRAFSPGGASTSYLAADKLDVRFEYEDLKAAGSALGCATIRVVPDGACMVEELQRFASFFAAGSCGQCGPCVQGTRKIASIAEEVRLGTVDQRPLDTLARLGQRLPGMGICGLITGATYPAASALALFGEDFRHHATYGVCPGLGTARPVPHRHAWAPSRTEALRRPHAGGVRRSRWY
jgi:NADH-quinone oxidoreductase subunit F